MTLSRTAASAAPTMQARPADAAREYQEALRLNPEDDRLREHLGKLASQQPQPNQR